MNDIIKKISIGLGVAAVLALAALSLWYFFFLRGGVVPAQPSTNTTQQNGGFGVGTNTTGVVVPPSQSGVPPGFATAPGTLQKIFKIADGPVASATFIQTQNPTTTAARYIMADNGHVFDQAVDVPGAVARAASNTTIPGVASAQWGARGSATVLQYLDGRVVKTVYVGLASTTGQATHIQFLPDNISSFAISPAGTSIVYTLVAQGGTGGWVANLDGSNQKKIFSLPLTQLLVSWPSPNILLIQTRASAGVPGMLFSADIKTGTVVPLIYALGLSATANSSFTRILYQTNTGGVRATYSRDVVIGGDTALSFQPIPEKCLWSNLDGTILYCASPLVYVGPNYLDLWHQGTASAQDGVFGFNTQTGATLLAASPGGQDGGSAADVAQIAISADEKYLLYVTKGDRSLWGVRLAQ